MLNSVICKWESRWFHSLTISFVCYCLNYTIFQFLQIWQLGPSCLNHIKQWNSTSSGRNETLFHMTMRRKLKYFIFHAIKYKRNREWVMSSVPSFAYWPGCAYNCFVKLSETLKCYNFLILHPILMTFSVLCLFDFDVLIHINFFSGVDLTFKDLKKFIWVDWKKIWNCHIQTLCQSFLHVPTNVIWISDSSSKIHCD